MQKLVGAFISSLVNKIDRVQETAIGFAKESLEKETNGGGGCNWLCFRLLLALFASKGLLPYIFIIITCTTCVQFTN